MRQGLYGGRASSKTKTSTLSQVHVLSVRIEKEIEVAIPGTVTTIHIEDQEWCQKAQAEAARTE